MKKLDEATIDNLPPLISVAEAARIARVSEKHVRDLLHEGAIKGGKLGTAWRINSADFIHHLGIGEGV